VLGLFGVALLALAVALPTLIPLLLGARFSADEQTQLVHLFVMLIPAHLVIAVEAPLVGIVTARKQAGVVIAINLAFLLLYSGILALFSRFRTGVDGVPIALLCAQFLNLVLYSIIVKNVFSHSRLLQKAETLLGSPQEKLTVLSLFGDGSDRKFVADGANRAAKSGGDSVLAGYSQYIEAHGPAAHWLVGPRGLVFNWVLRPGG
jgi:hypothetical protein